MLQSSAGIAKESNLTGMVKRMTTPVAYRNISSFPIETETDYTHYENTRFTPRVVGRERRAKRRFPIQLPAELCIREMRFRGTTVNISSGGLLIKCSHSSLKIGRRVTVRITNWPNSKGKQSDVTLVIEGAVVRDSTGFIAIRRTRYEFIELSEEPACYSSVMRTGSPALGSHCIKPTN
jgi:hypothetical protein